MIKEPAARRAHAERRRDVKSHGEVIPASDFRRAHWPAQRESVRDGWDVYLNNILSFSESPGNYLSTLACRMTIQLTTHTQHTHALGYPLTRRSHALSLSFDRPPWLAPLPSREGPPGPRVDSGPCSEAYSACRAYSAERKEGLAGRSSSFCSTLSMIPYARACTHASSE